MPPRQLEPRNPAGAGGGRAACAGEGPGAPLPERRGVHRRARAGPSRAHAPGRARGTSSEPRRGGERDALVDLGAGRRRGGRDRHRRVPAVPATASRCRTSSAARPSEAARSSSAAGSRCSSSRARPTTCRATRSIAQDPAAGTEVREGSTVTVTISGGPGEVPVPAVEGESREDAQRALEDAGFKVKVEEEFSDDVPEGDVISSSPEGGTQATKGRTVTITVSQGAEGIAVPKVVGLQRRRGPVPAGGAGPEVRRHRAGDHAAGRDRDAAGPGDGHPRRPRRRRSS